MGPAVGTGSGGPRVFDGPSMSGWSASRAVRERVSLPGWISQDAEDPCRESEQGVDPGSWRSSSVIEMKCPACGVVGRIPKNKVNVRLVCSKCLKVFYVTPSGRAVA